MKQITRWSHLSESGQILITLVIVIPAMILIVSAYFSLSTSGYRLERNDQFRVVAQATADAGADYAIEQLNTNTNWTPAGTETVLQTVNNTKTTYAVSLTNVDASNKSLVITGRTYFPANSATASKKVKIKLDLRAVNSGTSGSSVASGVGGLILGSNAKISGGDVVVNGKVTLNSNSQIGLSTNAVNVRVAHQSCPIPANSTYPQVCGTGQGQPISMGSNTKIYADVRATNQTTGTNMFTPGLIPGQTVTPVSLPTYDRASQIAAVTTTKPSSDSTIACSSNQSKSWPANLKITGDVTLGSNCTVTINGNVWVTGNVVMGSNSKFVIANSLGTNRPTFMVDGGNAAGTGGFTFGSNSQIQPNASNTGAQVISFWSNGACSPNCSDVTGTDLYNSQNVATITLDSNGSASYSILWSRWTKVKIASNGALGAVTGQTIELGSNAVINFTASVPGSNNIVTTWVKSGYAKVFN